MNMNKQQLQEKLIKSGIDSNAYSLEGGLPNEAYCLNHEANIWEVYYSERGNKTSLNVFSTEAEACLDMYKRLIC
jgi:hypothetical protein